MDKIELWRHIRLNSIALNDARIKVRVLEERRKELLFELEQLNGKNSKVDKP